jgi:thiol:disulfide interchange protein DsbD
MIFIATFFLGLQLGATACAISCMPVLAPILLNKSDNKLQSLGVLYKFFSAKIVAYTLISSLAFFGSAFIKNNIQSIQINKFLGVVIILLGIVLLIKSIQNKTSCKTSCTDSTFDKSSYFLIGFFSSFSFCVPLLSLVTISASSSSFEYSLFYGISFGLGVVTIPFLFFYLFIYQISSHILKELSSHKTKIEFFASSILILVGFLIFFELLKL